MVKTAKSILALLLVLMTSFSSLAQEENVKQEKPTGHKVKEEVAQMYSLVEFTDFSSLSPAQKKHFELYRRQKQMRLAGTYDPKKCFAPIYTPMADFAKQLRPLAVDAAEKAQKTFEKLARENKTQMAKRIQMHYNAYVTIAKQCEKVESAFKDRKTGDLEEALTIMQRQMIALKKEGLKVPNREWLTQKEADVIMAKVARQKKAMHGVPQGGVNQQPNVKTQTNGNK